MPEQEALHLSFPRTKGVVRFRGRSVASPKLTPGLSRSPACLICSLVPSLSTLPSSETHHEGRFGKQAGASHHPIGQCPPSLQTQGPAQPCLLHLSWQFSRFSNTSKTGISQDCFHMCGRDLFLIRAFKSNLLLPSFAKCCSIKS